MILYSLIRKLRDLISVSSKVTEYTLRMQKSITSGCITNSLAKEEIWESILLIISFKKLGINLTSKVKALYSEKCWDPEETLAQWFPTYGS